MGRVRRPKNFSLRRIQKRQPRRHRQAFEALVSRIESQRKATKYQLCDRCRNIDFKSIFESDKVDSSYGEHIQVLDELLFDPACSVCQLIASIADKEYRSSYELRVYSATSVFGALKTELDQQSQSIALAVLPKYFSWEVSNIRKVGAILPFKPQTWAGLHQFLFQGNLVNPRSVDYDLVLQWLAECDNYHKDTCVLRAGNPVALRCIDCHQKEILKVVPIRDTDRYIALSYVWGADAIAALQEEIMDSISKPVPVKKVSQVVQDAMQVVSALGERYLWVDYHCIDQKNHDFKASQIQAMDYIYAGAYVTIIASAGLNASCGLPGVSRARKVNQPIALTPSVQMISALPGLSECIENTIWNTRGWVYQEATLSRTCLFFTEEQVHFLCPRMTRCESVLVKGAAIWPDGKNLDRTRHMFRSKLKSLYREHLRPASQVFVEHVEEYSHRTLSYDDDILNAFRGILARSPFWTYYGIPIAIESKYWVDSRDGNIGFARGLFWGSCLCSKADQGLKRRPGFPSWSWAGWKGHVAYFSKQDIVFESDNSVIAANNAWRLPNADFWIADEIKGRLCTFKERVIAAGTSMILTELNTHLVMEAQVFHLHFQPLFDSNGDQREFEVCVCACHLQSVHDGEKIHYFGDCNKGRVVFFDPARENNFYNRMVAETWDCVLLYGNEKMGWVTLVIEWHGEIAEVVGNVRLRNCTELEELATERRTIHMG